VTARITAENLGVRFQLDRQQRPVTPTLARVRRRCTTVWAVRRLTFAIEPGAGVALVGPNGAGKTTLLRAIAGVLPADEGRVAVRGRIGSLLAVDAGLMPWLTGRENSLLLGVLAGLPKKAVSRALESLQDRSGLSAAFDRPVSTYSQGMR
jgi:ABC-type polysaccharide/polyol phosphate transport system ATPase subunit